jgi:hypothetical protein
LAQPLPLARGQLIKQDDMLRPGRRSIITILTAVFFSLHAAGAVTGDADGDKAPWYAAWYLWLGLGIFIISLVAVLGTTNQRK